MVYFNLGNKRVQGEIIKTNEKTVLVKYNGKIIKRHKEKHDVREDE